MTWVTVPDLIGLERRRGDARRCACPGSRCAQTTGAYGKPLGRVYSQYPIPLRLAAKGALITLIVSDGTG